MKWNYKNAYEWEKGENKKEIFGWDEQYPGAELHVRVGGPKIFEIFFLLYRNF